MGEAVYFVVKIGGKEMVAIIILLTVAAVGIAAIAAVIATAVAAAFMDV